MEFPAYGFIIIYIILFIGIGMCSEGVFDSPKTSIVFASFLSLTIIWNIISFCSYSESAFYLKSIPIEFKKETAFIYNDGDFVNCSKIFKRQFNPGDSIYVYKEIESVSMGVVYGNNDNVNYQIEKIKNE